MSATSGMYAGIGKRTLDLVASILLLPLLLPVMAIISLLIRIQLGSPVLFTQERLGRDGRPFFIRKFRTMTEARDPDGNLLPDGDRLTPTGRFLRATSLDELPELINILRGEMSFVGPRPLYSCYRDRYTAEQMRRHEVRPGITGWAQVNGRNTVNWEQRFELDVWYVNRCSLWLDSKILLLTAWKVLQREGISQEGHVTMSNFMGTAETGGEKKSRVHYGSR